MGTFQDRRNHIMSKANPVAPCSDLAWFHPANFYSRTSLNLLHSNSTSLNLEPRLSMAPVRYIATGTNEPSKNLDLEYKQSKKPKLSQKSSDDTKTPMVLKPRIKKFSGSKKEKTIPTTVGKRIKKDQTINMTPVNLDFSGLPSPVCSCTGESRICYKWGVGGWQSSCCTINISEYPLPFRPSRPGSRIAGRKMSQGAYGKLLVKLEAEGYDLNNPVDLKCHWARHGTNKFVTIR